MTSEIEPQSDLSVSAGDETSAPIKYPVAPAIFIPTLYIAEGLPYTIVNLMSVVYLKKLGAETSFITDATTTLSLAWTLKFLWAPLIDIYGTRRNWIIVAQLVLFILCCGLALFTKMSPSVNASVIILGLIALASATQDVAIDGYYMDVLNEKQQALFVGVRNAFYKIALLVGQGPLVMVAGYVAATTGGATGMQTGWAVAFAVAAIIFLCSAIVHNFALPRLRNNLPPKAVVKEQNSPNRFLDILKTFFTQERIIAISLYILIFRLGDALMLKMAPIFLLDPSEKGGLALTVVDVGYIYGTVGPIFLLIGGLLGGFLVSRYGLKRCLMPTALIQNGAILLYWALAIYKPQNHNWILAVNSFEQFAYGLGVAAYTVFLLSVVRPEYKAAHYAIATALMSLGLIIPGYLSGHLATWLGYPTFFLISFLLSIPGIITIFFLPIKDHVVENSPS